MIKHKAVQIFLMVCLMLSVTISGSGLATSLERDFTVYRPDKSSMNFPAALPMGAPFLISDNVLNGFDPSVIYNSEHDEYLVVWDYFDDVYARRVSSRGELLGDMWWVTSDSEDDNQPVVAYDFVHDHYLIVWMREVTSGNYRMFGRFIPWNGPNPGSPQFEISTTSVSGNDHQFQVAFTLAQGEFLAVWTTPTGGWPEYNIVGRRLKADGSGFPAGTFTIASNPSENRQNPDLAYNLSRNEYLVTYDNDYIQGTNNENIYATRMAGDGTPLGGGEFSVADWPDDELLPAVAACGAADQFLVTWQSIQVSGPKLYARFINGDGVLGNVYQIDDSTPSFPYGDVDLSCRWGVQYLLTWERWYPALIKVGIWGRQVYSDESMDPKFEIVAPDPDSREAPALASGDPNFLLAWENRDSGGYADIYGRILGETKPLASFTVTPPSGDVNTIFQFDASGSSDGQDPPASLQVRWDWHNDGVYDTPWSYTKTSTHQFGSLGTKTVRLQVKDTYGLTDVTTRQVGIGNTPPSAAFTVSPSVGSGTTTFQFDASSSSDNEYPSNTLEVRWDWQDDGIYDTNWSINKTASHVFPGGYGLRTIRLEVRDPEGLADSTTGQVLIDNPPTAVFNVTPSQGNIFTNFLFDASGSSDPDVGIYWLEVRWDWQNDGTFDTGWSTTKTASHKFPVAGTYTIRMEIRQNAVSLTDSTTRQVNVVHATIGPQVWLPLVVR
jgi:hypothetical protein